MKNITSRIFLALVLTFIFGDSFSQSKEEIARRVAALENDLDHLAELVGEEEPVIDEDQDPWDFGSLFHYAEDGTEDRIDEILETLDPVELTAIPVDDEVKDSNIIFLPRNDFPTTVSFYTEKEKERLVRRSRDSVRLIENYLPRLERAFDYTDLEEISLILDQLLRHEYVPDLLIDTVREYAIFAGLAERSRRNFLVYEENAYGYGVQIADKVNGFGNYGILPNWQLYGDSIAYNASGGDRWAINRMIHPGYYHRSKRSILFPYYLPLIDQNYGYHPFIKVEDMASVYSPYCSARYHPVYRRLIPHKRNDYHTKKRRTDDPEEVYAEFWGILRVRKYDRDAGKSMVVRYFNGLEGYFKHLSEFGDFVPGDTIYPGDVLGKIGGTGRGATGPHLCHGNSLVGIPINDLYLSNWTEYIRVPDKRSDPKRYIQTVELKRDLNDWHRGVPVGGLCSPTLIIQEPGSAEPNKNVYLCPSVDRCRIEIPGKETVSAPTLGEKFQASSPTNP
jgi:murein DD-endopeptidase MepM/ murein hydrolase activator NlpD